MKEHEAAALGASLAKRLLESAAVDDDARTLANLAAAEREEAVWAASWLLVYLRRTLEMHHYKNPHRVGPALQMIADRIDADMVVTGAETFLADVIREVGGNHG